MEAIMIKYDDSYISKKECERRGFLRTEKGVRKMTLLEKLCYGGRLSYGTDKYRSEDRLAAGERFISDYEKNGFKSVQSSLGKEKVDCSIKGGDKSFYICSRYLNAKKYIPREFWPAVKKICLDNKLPEPDEKIPARRRSEMAYAFYNDLCRGLDRLIEFYTASNSNYKDI